MDTGHRYAVSSIPRFWNLTPAVPRDSTPLSHELKKLKIRTGIVRNVTPPTGLPQSRLQGHRRPVLVPCKTLVDTFVLDSRVPDDERPASVEQSLVFTRRRQLEHSSVLLPRVSEDVSVQKQLRD